MPGWRRRIVRSLLGVVTLVFVYTVLYQWAMVTFEGTETTALSALQTVVEAITTAGFGGDADKWTTPALNLLVVAMNLTGVVLVFLALPLFVVPLFQEALEETPQESTELTDHIIICSYNSREDVLRSQLDAADVPYVVVENDPDTVLELNNDGIEAIYGDPEREQTFQNANIESARAVVADVSDEQNVSVILTARELNEEVLVVSVAENRQDTRYHRYAGADRVVRPRQVLGRSLARKATLSISRDFKEILELDSDFELSELLVKEHSDLAGKTIAQSNLRDRDGITIIGLWSNGEFVPSPEPKMRIRENSILLAAGSHHDLEQLNTQVVSPESSAKDRILVVGYGVVGESVIQTLDEAGIDHTVVDTEPGDEVDVVGDVTDPEVLSEADVENARFVILAMDDDTATMYTTVALEQRMPDIQVIARTNDVDNTAKIYRAGAEYVLALSTVTGRMLSSVLLEDEEVLTPDTQFEIVRTVAPKLAGQTLGEADIGDQTGATVVAAERNDELLTNLGPEFTVQDTDTLIVAGSDTAVNEFISIAR
jgi:Trk K+ transport system NAD-binding subunit